MDRKCHAYQIWDSIEFDLEVLIISKKDLKQVVVEASLKVMSPYSSALDV